MPVTGQRPRNSRCRRGRFCLASKVHANIPLNLRLLFLVQLFLQTKISENNMSSYFVFCTQYGQLGSLVANLLPRGRTLQQSYSSTSDATLVSHKSYSMRPVNQYRSWKPKSKRLEGCSAAKLGFPHEEGAEQCKKHNDNHECKTLVDRRPVAAAHNLCNIGIQLLDVV